VAAARSPPSSRRHPERPAQRSAPLPLPSPTRCHMAASGGEQPPCRDCPSGHCRSEATCELDPTAILVQGAPGSPKIGDKVHRMTFGERFAETSVTGALTRAAVAWVLITPAVAAAKVWWSGTAPPVRLPRRRHHLHGCRGAVPSQPPSAASDLTVHRAGVPTDPSEWVLRSLAALPSRLDATPARRTSVHLRSPFTKTGHSRQAYRDP
jgi:hypothetical protein